MASEEDQLIAAVEETRKKVTSSLSSSVNRHVTNDAFDYRKDGLDFLEVKNSVMMSYLIDLTHLVRLKALPEKQRKKSDNANQIKSCLERLGEMKVILEKIRPMERKMQYQIDKILAVSVSSGVFANVNETKAEEEVEEEVDTVVESDPLAFRPNPESLMDKDESGDESDSEEDKRSSDSSDSEVDDDDEELRAARATLKIGKSKSKSNDDSDEETGVYKAPRLSATPFSEPEKASEKEERILKRQQDRMRKSELLSTLKSAYGDAPEEDDFTGGAAIGKERETARRFAEREAEKTKFEEEAFIRLTTSRKEKKLKNRIMREETSNLNSIADLGNLTAGVSMAFGNKKKGERDYDIKVGGPDSSRHANGKRRREGGDADQKRRKSMPKNSFQKALYGMDGVNGKKKKSKR